MNFRKAANDAPIPDPVPPAPPREPFEVPPKHWWCQERKKVVLKTPGLREAYSISNFEALERQIAAEYDVMVKEMKAAYERGEY